MSFFRHHRDKNDNNRQDPPPATYSQPPSSYNQPPPAYNQPPPSYNQPPPSYTQPPTAYSHPPQGYSHPPPACSQQPYPPQPQTYPPAYSQQPPTYSHQPPYSQQPPACSQAPPCPAGSYAGEANSSTFRVYTLAGESYSLSIREGTVVLVPTNPRDELQHWYKDFRWGTKVKDEEGLPAFALINKATGLAIKHSLGPTHPVRLVAYNPEYLDESVLWSESHDTGEGYRCIRMVNNIRLNFDAFNGDKKHGGVHDGTTIVLWEWAKGKNQRWKIVPYY